VLVYTSEPFKEGIELSGPITPTLYVSSDAKDTDFTVKVLDVYPDGRAYNLDESIQRMRYREGYDKPPVWMEKGKVYKVALQPLTTSNYFAPGHRLRIEVSSSNFPRFDRNLNTGGNNYDENQPVVARNVVHHSTQYPSSVTVTVVRCTCPTRPSSTGMPDQIQHAFAAPRAGERRPRPVRCRLRAQRLGPVHRPKMSPSSRNSGRLSSGAFGCVTTTCGTKARRASAVVARFSSTLTTTCEGASARTRSRSTSLVPPTVGTACHLVARVDAVARPAHHLPVEAQGEQQFGDRRDERHDARLRARWREGGALASVHMTALWHAAEARYSTVNLWSVDASSGNRTSGGSLPLPAGPRAGV
jgi:hypothetical protein